MRHFLNNTALLPISLAGILATQQAPAATFASPSDASLTSETAPQWTLVTAFSYSFFNRGYDSWHQESMELYHYLPEQKVLLGAMFEHDQRSAGRDDFVYGLNAAWYTNEKLELHGGVELVDDADFLPGERYNLGLKYRVNPRYELLFDIDQMEFSDTVASWDDGITQIRPGFTWWFNENKRATFRWTHGWVHDESDYDYYSVKFHIDELIRDGVVSLGFAYGTDPDFGFGTGTSLSEAYHLSLFYTEPITEDLKFFIGFETVYRLRPDNNQELYHMWTPSIGLSWKF